MNQNWQGYHTQKYNFTRNHIDMYAEQLFYTYDRDRSGQLALHELHPLLNEFARKVNSKPVSPQDAQYMMYMFDVDGSG